VQLELCAIPAIFSRAIYSLLIQCLYLAYSKLLKLTAASNAGTRFTKYRSIIAGRIASVHTCDKDSGRRRYYTHDQSCVARRRVSGLALITESDDAEMLKEHSSFA